MSWQAAEGVMTEEIDGETILLDSSGNRYLTLNETASAIFRLAASGTAAPEIVDALVQGWTIDAATARRTVARFTTKLVDAGLLEPI
jgi:hypothetical protein